MTVKELKELLANVDDSLEVMGYQSGMEQSGIMPVSKAAMGTVQGEMVTRHTWDRFDGTDYDYTVFEEKKGGTKSVFRIF